MKTETRTIFVADDGTEFATRAGARRHACLGMSLRDIKPGVMYVHTPDERIVNFLTADPEDGASLIVEARDRFGDVCSGVLFRCESCDLKPATRADYEKVYPPGGDHCDFADVGGVEP